MSSYRTAATATLIPPFPTFPTFIPEPPRPHHIPLAPRGLAPTRLNEVRDLPHELDDLSEEENELEDMRNDIKNRGMTWIIPIGKLQTLQEEKNDGSPDASEGANSDVDVGDNEPESAQDLDASMIDLDDGDGEEDEDEGISGDLDASIHTADEDLSALEDMEPLGGGESSYRSEDMED